MEDMAYFNPEYKVNASFTIKIMIDNHLQNELMRKLSRGACKQDPLMHLTVQVHMYILDESASMDIHRAKEFASQELPRFTSALYHAAQTVALGPWWIISITSSFSPCLRSNRFLKLPCATTESWWISGGSVLDQWWMDPFQIPFQITEEDGNPNSEGCSYIHTHPQKVLAPSITLKSQSLPPPAAATGFVL